MSENDIIRITKVNNIQIKNLHGDFLFPKENILEIENRKGDIRILSLVSERDITDIDYFAVCETSKTKRRDLFMEYSD